MLSISDYLSAHVMYLDSQIPRDDYRQADLIVTLLEDSCVLNVGVTATPCFSNSDQSLTKIILGLTPTPP